MSDTETTQHELITDQAGREACRLNRTGVVGTIIVTGPLIVRLRDAQAEIARDPEIQTAADGQPEAVFVPEQRLTVAQAIDGYTIGAAFAGRHEKTEGSLEAGKVADLIILSQNIFDIDAHKIGAAKVITTIVGGRLVYQADAK